MGHSESLLRISLSPTVEVGTRITIRFDDGEVLGHRANVTGLGRPPYKSQNGFGLPCDIGSSRFRVFTSNVNFHVWTMLSKRIT